MSDEKKSVWETLRKIDVSEHTEQKKRIDLFIVGLGLGSTERSLSLSRVRKTFFRRASICAG